MHDIERCMSVLEGELERPPVEDAFITWCTASGVFIGSIRAGFVPEGWRGIIATSSIDADECVLSVPRELLLCCDSARRDVAVTAALRTTGAAHTDVQVRQLHG